MKPCEQGLGIIEMLEFDEAFIVVCRNQKIAILNTASGFKLEKTLEIKNVVCSAAIHDADAYDDPILCVGDIQGFIHLFNMSKEF
jgi:hypothetical protein